MKVHLVVYSQGEPYDTTKRRTIETVHQYTTKELVIHEYSLDLIKTRDWFEKIAHLPTVTRDGRRDGYYCAYKAFITHEVYHLMDDADLLYYVDSSQYFIEGFTHSIDELCDVALRRGCIAGSIGMDVRNNSYSCCDTIEAWNLIIPGSDDKYLHEPHVLSTWYLFSKNETNTEFMNEWIKWDVYEGSLGPLTTYHHTADQAVYNILVVKYNLPVFHRDDISHNENKDKNRVLQISEVGKFLRGWRDEIAVHNA
jgi:hypothetical protein